jgi:hypothetical protein
MVVVPAGGGWAESHGQNSRGGEARRLFLFVGLRGMRVCVNPGRGLSINQSIEIESIRSSTRAPLAFEMPKAKAASMQQTAKREGTTADDGAKRHPPPPPEHTAALQQHRIPGSRPRSHRPPSFIITTPRKATSSLKNFLLVVSDPHRGSGG